MRLDRNTSGDGRGKYGLIITKRLREIEAWNGGEGEALDRQAVIDAIELLQRAKVIEWGEPNSENEFFVIKLKDKYADDALFRYALSAKYDGEGDYGREVEELANRAGVNSPFCKNPD